GLAMKFPGLLPFSLLALAALSACTVAREEEDPESAPSQYVNALSSTDGALVVDLVNDPRTDLEVLDKAVGLDVRAAKNIVAARNGKDGISPSADDVPFA